jgi:hypothetical protein
MARLPNGQTHVAGSPQTLAHPVDGERAGWVAGRGGLRWHWSGRHGSPGQPSVRNYLKPLRLGYPVALDTTGRLADGYDVLDQPWFVQTSATGKIIWKHDGWLPVSALESAVRKA